VPDDEAPPAKVKVFHPDLLELGTAYAGVDEQFHDEQIPRVVCCGNKPTQLRWAEMEFGVFCLVPYSCAH
jgi:hypothetical protein